MKTIGTIDPASTHVQVAALPWRSAPDIQILLVSSRETRRWVAPKGWPMKGKTAPASAEREAMEEAGVEGEIDAEPIGAYHYVKRMKNGSTRTLRVDVYPLQVARQRKNWPEKHERTTRWLTVEEAAACVHEPELQALIRAFGAMLEERVRMAQVTAG